MRCTRLALAGFVSGFIAWPAPYFRDRDCWMRGKAVACFLVVVVAIASIFGTGLIAGRLY